MRSLVGLVLLRKRRKRSLVGVVLGVMLKKGLVLELLMVLGMVLGVMVLVVVRLLMVLGMVLGVMVLVVRVGVRVMLQKRRKSTLMGMVSLETHNNP